MTDRPVPTGLERFIAERERVAATGWEGDTEHHLSDLMSAAVVELAGNIPDGCAVVAIGGFGRAVMAVRSDVDLLFLHEGSGFEELTRAVLRPLWDARLKVGHLTHTPKRAREFAGTRLDAISTLLTARLLAGDEATFDDFRRRFNGLLEKEFAQIVTAMAAEERRRRDEEPYRLMAGDLKNGRGGIRTLDMLDWRRRLLATQGVAGAEARPGEEAARVAFTRIRSALHAVTGRLHDRYDFEIRPAAARWLGTGVPELGAEIMHLRTSAEAMVDDSWAELAPARRDRIASDLVEATRERGDIVRWWRSGVLDGFPEIDRLLEVPHIVPFHRYGVSDHTLAAVDEVWSMLGDPDDDPIVREVVSSLGGAPTLDSRLLVLAVLLHDIGKGMGGDHCRVGAGMVASIGRRLGLDPEAGAVLKRLVEHHLLLAELATAYDHDDPTVLAWVADRVGDRRTLRLLYLVTVADSRATGSDTWSPWRAELLRRAYRRLERELGRRAMPEAVQVELLADRVVSAADGALDRQEVESHLAGLPAAYRSAHSPSVIRDHVRLARRPLGPGGGLVEIYPDVPARLVVSATDRPRLLLDVAGVLAIRRLSIIDARFATRSDGRVFDTFEVVDAGRAAVDRPRLERVRTDLERALRGGVDVVGVLEAKQHAYRDTRRTGVDPVVQIARTEDGGGRIEVECADRLGLLHDIGVVFDRFGMPITRARADTRGGVAFDTFVVSRLPADTAGLEQALLAAVE